MASELQFSFSSGKTCYVLIRNRNGQVWNTNTLAFEAYASVSYLNYTVSASEQGSSGFYTASMPTQITAGIFDVVAKQQTGGSAAETDPTIAVGEEQWDGVNTLPLCDLASSGQISQFAPIRLARGTMIRNFMFDLVSAVDHVTPFTSGVVSGQIVRDNGSWGPLQSGAFTEVGLGVYALQSLTSGDLLCNTAALWFQGIGISGGISDPRRFSLVLQRSSGQ